MPTLFDPLKVGALNLPNRIVMAPLTRSRAHPETRVPSDLAVTYYSQRADAGLIISEATHISPNSVSRPGTSAIHNDTQVAAWRRVTDAVHLAGGRIVQQLFHLGRKADPARLPTAATRRRVLPGGRSRSAAARAGSGKSSPGSPTVWPRRPARRDPCRARGGP